MTDAFVTLEGGRRLAFTDAGHPGGACIVFCHGAPASRLQVAGLDAQLAARGLRVVSPDRPGYGKSSPRPGRALADWPADVAALADALSVRRFAVAGHSTGGPHAVACAALLPDRVTAALVLAGVTDMGWSPAWDGYTEVEKELMRLGDESEIVAACARRFGADGGAFATESGFELPVPDQALFADEAAAAAMASDLAEAFRQGVGGYAQDVFVQSRPWSFDPGGIRCAVDVVHGDADTLIPIAHSRHTAASIPDARLRVLPGHGHLTLLSELPALASAAVSPQG
jgi:pimeloyl-ACP methyl ester carboxylesterase